MVSVTVELQHALYHGYIDYSVTAYMIPWLQ